MMFDLRDALCAGADPELWFPLGVPGSPGYVAAAAPAREVCALCPVRDACLDRALALGVEDGIFAGLDSVERRHEAMLRRRAQRRLARARRRVA